MQTSLRQVALGFALSGTVLACGSANHDSSGGDATSTGGTGGNGSTESTTGSATTGSATTGSATTGSATTGSGNGTTDATSSATTGNSTGGAGGDGSATESSTSVGGAAGSGAGGTGGDGGACPAAPPADGSECSHASQVCAYQDCGGVGRSIAVCQSGAWTVEVGPCVSDGYCSGGADGKCNVGEVCLVISGGAHFEQCVPNACGAGPVGCDCISGCTGQCTVLGDLTSGIRIDCNTCPSGQCA